MKKYFLTGLAILLPLAVTLAVLGFIIKFLTEPFIDLVSHFLSRLNIINTGFLFLTPEQLLKYGSELLILILLFLFILGLGILARWFFLHALIGLGDKILQRIPLVNTVYKTSRDITKTLFAADKKTLKEVVMVPFPKSGIYVLGLIAREAPDTCSNAVKEELISVFCSDNTQSHVRIFTDVQKARSHPC